MSHQEADHFKLKVMDAHIKRQEQKLERLHAARREYINRCDLNAEHKTSNAKDTFKGKP